jgi:hypothetical protein
MQTERATNAFGSSNRTLRTRRRQYIIIGVEFPNDHCRSRRCNTTRDARHCTKRGHVRAEEPTNEITEINGSVVDIRG